MRQRTDASHFALITVVEGQKDPGKRDWSSCKWPQLTGYADDALMYIYAVVSRDTWMRLRAVGVRLVQWLKRMMGVRG